MAAKKKTSKVAGTKNAGKRKSARRAKPARGKGLLFPFADREDYELGRQFLADPARFLRRAGLKLSDVACPEEAHEAFARAEEFANRAEGLQFKAGDLKVPKDLKRLAERHFGKDFETALIPFGLKFRERLPRFGREPWTATASGTLTFCDSDADLDA